MIDLEGVTTGEGTPTMEPQSPFELALRLQTLIEENTYVPGIAEGSQSAGKTLEHYLVVDEPNGRLEPDLSMGIELKAINTGQSTPTTLFTREPTTKYRWGTDLVEHYETPDEVTASNAVDAVHTSLFAGKTDPHGLTLRMADNEDILVWDTAEDAPVARYNHSEVLGDFKQKFGDLVCVWFASANIGLDTANQDTVFDYTDAVYYHDVDSDMFLELIREGDVQLDIRMKVRPDGTLRNHGTAWRVTEQFFKDVYQSSVGLTPDVDESALPSLNQEVIIDRDPVSSIREPVIDTNDKETDMQLSIPQFDNRTGHDVQSSLMSFE